MYLKRLILSNFKNIEGADLIFSPKFNSVVGSNGSGKTNLLDAIWYLSMTKSFLSSSDTYIYRYGEREVVLSGGYIKEDEIEEKIAIRLREGEEKVLKRDDKQYERLSDHIGEIPVVIVSPADSSLIHEAGEERRRFLNLIISQIDRAYLRSVQSFNKMLSQRNLLLKAAEPNWELIDTISLQLSGSAQYIYEKRGEVVGMLNEKAGKLYEDISGGSESIELQYASDLSKGTLFDLLDRTKDKDKALGYTSVGVQRDDMVMLMDGHPVRKCGSQGQQKSLQIALKLSQFDVLKEVKGQVPILLLDDLFDKLDMSRVDKLIRIVADDNYGQIFITDSNKTRVDTLIGEIASENKRFRAEKGGFEELKIES